MKSEWIPEKGGLGGSEEAVIYLSLSFSKRNLNVTVFCNVLEKVEYGEVNFIPFWKWNPFSKSNDSEPSKYLCLTSYVQQS